MKTIHNVISLQRAERLLHAFIACNKLCGACYQKMILSLVCIDDSFFIYFKKKSLDEHVNHCTAGSFIPVILGVIQGMFPLLLLTCKDKI